MITRRRVVATIGAAALAPLVSFAQQPAKVWRIGFLAGGVRTADGAPPAPLRQALRELGYVDGNNVTYIGRWAEAKSALLPSLAAELVRLKVDLIVVTGAPASEALKQATATIPIVCAGAGDMVGVGLVASLARPGGNITGITELSTELSAKRLEILKEAIPRAARIAVLWNADDRSMTLRYQQTEKAARLLRVTIQQLGVHEPDDFGVAISAMTRNRPDALFMVTDALTFLNRKRVLDFAAAHRIPAMYERGNLVEQGGLMSYGPDGSDSFRRVALYVDKILKGAKPAELPVEQPTKYYFVINLKTAKALGLTIPQSLLLRADRVIE